MVGKGDIKKTKQNKIKNWIPIETICGMPGSEIVERNVSSENTVVHNGRLKQVEDVREVNLVRQSNCDISGCQIYLGGGGGD